MSQLVTAGYSLREAFGLALVEQAKKGIDFLVLSADVAGGTGVYNFRKAFPEKHQAWLTGQR